MRVRISVRRIIEFSKLKELGTEKAKAKANYFVDKFTIFYGNGCNRRSVNCLLNVYLYSHLKQLFHTFEQEAFI